MSKRDVDKFGVRHPSTPSILITISVDSSLFTKVTELDYTVPLMGVKTDTKEIHIIRSFSPRKKYLYIVFWFILHFIEEPHLVERPIGDLPATETGN